MLAIFARLSTPQALKAFSNHFQNGCVIMIPNLTRPFGNDLGASPKRERNKQSKNPKVGQVVEKTPAHETSER